MNNQNSIINNKKAIGNTQNPTATPSDSRIAPLSPIYSGYSNVWFVDWTHPDAARFIPLPNKLK